MTKRKHPGPPRRFWSVDEDAQLRRTFATEPTKAIAARLGRSYSCVAQHAWHLGLQKSAEYLVTEACRFNGSEPNSVAHRFRPGQVPHNKGLRRPGYSIGRGRMQETQFKKGVLNGRAAMLIKPIGFERISKDGYLERKVNNEMPFQRRWRAVHLIVWEAAHGPLPRGHAIVFGNGDKTDIRLDNLECITRRALMLRNTVHNLPKPLAQTVLLLGALKRQIRRRTHDATHD